MSYDTKKSEGNRRARDWQRATATFSPSVPSASAQPDRILTSPCHHSGHGESF